MRIVAIVQARLSSSRLAGKTMMPLGGTTVLGCVIDRLCQVSSIDCVVVATTINKNDDAIVEWCKNNNIEFFRGDEDNVLSRFVECAKYYKADSIVRVTSDNPLVDPSIVEKTINLYIETNADYPANNLIKSFPHGLDVEIVSFDALKISMKSANRLPEFEHVTQFVRHRSNRFKLVNLKSNDDYHQMRVTLDEIDDYQLIKIIYKLSGNSVDFIELIKLYKEFPALFNMNRQVADKHLEYNQSQKII